MPEPYYVAVDRSGVEHNADGDVDWALPDGAPAAPVAPGRDLGLRRPSALLDVLDERVYEAEPLAGGDERDGILAVRSARLTRPTGWDIEPAVRFAIDCARHALGPDGDVPLPDGTTLAAALDAAQANLEGAFDVEAEHLGAVARLLALHRLRKERHELGEMASELISEDLAKDLDALADPSYEELEPLIDAVLAAIVALRHHAGLRVLRAEEERAEDRAAHELLERTRPLPTPTPIVTPWGVVAVGGFHAPRYDPAWVGAREAARHARAAAGTAGGPEAAERERAWQAGRLAELLGT